MSNSLMPGGLAKFCHQPIGELKGMVVIAESLRSTFCSLLTEDVATKINAAIAAGNAIYLDDISDYENATADRNKVTFQNTSSHYTNKPKPEFTVYGNFNWNEVQSIVPTFKNGCYGVFFITKENLILGESVEDYFNPFSVRIDGQVKGIVKGDIDKSNMLSVFFNDAESIETSLLIELSEHPNSFILSQMAGTRILPISGGSAIDFQLYTADGEGLEGIAAADLEIVKQSVGTDITIGVLTDNGYGYYSVAVSNAGQAGFIYVRHKKAATYVSSPVKFNVS